MVVAGALLWLFASPVFAADVSNLIDGHFDSKSKTQRTEIAKELQKKLQILVQYLPSPRPQESAWLKQENDAIAKLGSSDAATSRRVQLALSPEFQHAKLHEWRTGSTLYLIGYEVAIPSYGPQSCQIFTTR